MKRIAVMQPYTFPYFGYFQLIEAVDTFVFFDDVQYIRRGYINRNSILNQGKAYSFTIPVKKAPQKTKINEVKINIENYEKWVNNFFKTIKNCYKHAPFYENTLELLQLILNQNHTKIDSLAKTSVKKIASYLEMETNFVNSSDLPYERTGTGQEKVISICQLLKAADYVNPPGGKSLYDPDTFAKNGLQLNFIAPQLPDYNQFQQPHVSNLSIIDQLMFMSKEEVQNNLTKNNFEIPTT